MFLAEIAYRKALATAARRGMDRVAAWRDLSIVFVPTINPFRMGLAPKPIPHAVEAEYFPSGVVEVHVGSEVVALDPLTDVAESDIRSRLPEIQEGLQIEPSISAYLSKYKSAGEVALRLEKWDCALRCFLNVWRSPGRDTFAWYDVAYALACLGQYELAADRYATLAHHLESAGQLGKAADCYERAGLAWEAAGELAERPSTRYGDEVINSSVAFLKAKSLSNRLGDYDDASRCFVMEREAQRRWTWSRARRLELAMVRMLWLYGESPWHAFRSIAVLCLVSAVIFLVAGFENAGEYIHYSLSGDFAISSLVSHVGSALYFSAVTMTTLGYGDYAPASALARVMAMIEAIFGFTLLAMLLVTMQRRFVGR